MNLRTKQLRAGRRTAWNELCDREPRLRLIEKEMAGVRRSWPAYGYFKWRISRLVGWFAHNPAMQSSADYETAVAFVAQEVAP